MVSRAISEWWTRMKPYYTRAYPEIWPGIAIMTFLYYKLSYGGKKAVKSTPTNQAHH
ncbi:ATP synthase subunit ATP5MPL, mitochondrial [Callorhinchus milii]|uniref:Mitochondrial proteolipid n=1 Tax=Callorhinchus milii TaxID=7868 RepID=K4GBU9_CALMI|nr:ATP synthase subunit ATP5MPL, mitochondrial [Callorhinchus milii]AFM86538.1 mitochondrial proteolipid [Callorhinchus milii]AFM87527.1 mitochondrial proteolipid [Callorhinchus milii]|eukprot:gi/632942510/ref/XP_007886449.1/ PREDICTED: 6.8 kDa mitochondrial proteolipid [Callorhinchus milii]